jgi:hypothetical protein
MSGRLIWDIGKILTNGSHEEIKKLHEEHRTFVQKWGGRCKTVYKNVPEQFRGQVPDDIAAARQISAFGEKLIECFTKNWITHSSTRKEIDRLYKTVCHVDLASRHP